MAALGDPAAVAQPEQPRRAVGDHLHRLLERHQLAAAEQSPRKRVVYGAPHMRSRCAPASEPPSMRPGVVPDLGAQRPATRRRRPVGIGHSTVRRSSAMTMSTSVSKGVLAALGARCRARPGPCRPSFAVGVGVADDVAPEVGEAAEHAGLLRLRRARASAARTSGSRSCSMRSGTGSAEDRRPSRACRLSAQKVRKLMFIGTSTGMVRATTRPPSSRRGRRPRAGAARGRARAASTVSTFQLSGRFGRGAHRRRAARSRRR